MAEATDVDADAAARDRRRPLGEPLELALRRPDRRGRGAAVLLRPRRVRRVRARHEDDRRRADDPAPRVRRVRDGRDLDRPGRAAPLADVRPGRRRARPASSWPARSASSPPRRCAPSTGRPSRRTRGCCCSTAAAPRWRRSAPKLSAKAAQALAQAGRRAAHGLGRHRRRRRRAASSATTTATSTRYDAGTVLWTAGVAGARRSPRRWPRPPGPNATGRAASRCSDDLTIPGHPEISVIGDMMSLRQAARRRRGRHAARPVRRAPDQARADGRRRRPSRSATTTWARPPTSPAATPSCRRGRCDSAASRLGRLAVHPHRVPDRLPQPARRDPHLVGRLHPGPPPRTRLHHPRGRALPRTSTSPPSLSSSPQRPPCRRSRGPRVTRLPRHQARRHPASGNTEGTTPDHHVGPKKTGFS